MLTFQYLLCYIEIAYKYQLYETFGPFAYFFFQISGAIAVLIRNFLCQYKFLLAPVQ